MRVASHLQSTRRTPALALALLAAGCSGDAPGPSGGDPINDQTLPDGTRPRDDGPPPVTLKVCATGADHQTIGAALAAATPGSTIEVCAGTYAERLVIEGKPVILRGAGADTTILDGGGGGPVVSVRLSGGLGVHLEGFSVRNGASAEGAGLRCEASVLRVAASVFEGNTASEAGGGLFASDCAVTVTGNRFAGNEGGTRGGGLYLRGGSGEVADNRILANNARYGGGASTVDNEIVFRTNEIRGNTCWSHGAGLDVISNARFEGNVIAGNTSAFTAGGVYVDDRAPTFAGNTIADNVSMNDGGGVYVHWGAPVFVDNLVQGNHTGDDAGGIRLFTSNGRLERNQFIGNRAPDGDGGAVKISHKAAMVIDNDFIDNECGGSGGAIEMDNDSSQVVGGTMTGNRAGRGGAIHGWLFPWRDARIQGVVMIGNEGGRGGGINLQDNFYPVVIRDVTVVGNKSRHGGGIYISRTQFTLSHSVIAGNVSRSESGGLMIGGMEAWQGPWIEPCPCPPVAATGTVDFVVIHGNKVTDALAGAGVWTDSGAWSMENSIVSGNEGATQVMVAPPPATPQNPMPAPTPPEWRWNDTFPATFAGMADPTGGNGNISVDPLFADAAQRNFQLQAGSACKNAGDPALTDADGSRADLGRFGGVMP